MNPYEPPANVKNSLPRAEFLAGEVISAHILFNSEHLLESLRRFRSQQPGRRLRALGRYSIGLILLLAGILVGVDGFAPAAIFFLLLALAIVFSPRISEYQTRRACKKSPLNNVQYEMEITEEGVRTDTEFEQTMVRWPAYTRAVFFEDGVLLYRGPQFIVWIPDHSLLSESGPTLLRSLVASKLPTN